MNLPWIKAFSLLLLVLLVTGCATKVPALSSITMTLVDIRTEGGQPVAAVRYLNESVISIGLAATRHRIEKGNLPESLDDLVPAFLPFSPADPFVADAPLRLKQTEGGLVIYSVGPDGENDGGPVAPGTEPAAGNDDVGLRLAQSASRTQ